MKKVVLAVIILCFGVLNVKALEGGESKIIFNVENVRVFHYTFEMYDLDDNFIQVVDVDNINNEIIFKRGKNIKLIDVSENNVLDRLEEIVIYDEGKETYEVNINVDIKNFNLKVESIMAPYEFDKDVNNIANDITIFNKNHEKIIDCREEICNVSLPMGDYFLTNNINNEQFLVELYSDLEMALPHFYIKGIISDELIEKVQKKNQIYELNKVNNFYYFDDLIYYDEYEIYINNEKFLIDLTDYKNFVLVQNHGLFYKFKLDEKSGEEYKKDEVILPNETEEIKEDVVNREEIKDEVIINIPNTGISLEREIIYDFKKKYDYTFKHINYNFS